VVSPAHSVSPDETKGPRDMKAILPAALFVPRPAGNDL